MLWNLYKVRKVLQVFASSCKVLQGSAKFYKLLQGYAGWNPVTLYNVRSCKFQEVIWLLLSYRVILYDIIMPFLDFHGFDFRDFWITSVDISILVYNVLNFSSSQNCFVTFFLSALCSYNTWTDKLLRFLDKKLFRHK